MKSNETYRESRPMPDTKGDVKKVESVRESGDHLIDVLLREKMVDGEVDARGLIDRGAVSVNYLDDFMDTGVPGPKSSRQYRDGRRKDPEWVVPVGVDLRICVQDQEFFINMNAKEGVDIAVDPRPLTDKAGINLPPAPVVPEQPLPPKPALGVGQHAKIIGNK